MPFIDTKVTVKTSDEERERIKSALGRAISIMKKPESYLMVGIEDNCTLYFAGEKLEKAHSLLLIYLESRLVLIAIR